MRLIKISVGLCVYICTTNTSRTGLSICNNYHQALEILDEAPTLARAMDELGIEDPHQFEEWQMEQKDYLEGLAKEPADETWQMEYLKKLLQLKSAKYLFYLCRNCLLIDLAVKSWKLRGES